MPKILFVSTSTTLGGAEKTLFTLATGVAPERFPVVGVVSLKPLGLYGDRLAARGFAVESLDVSLCPGPAEARRLGRIIRELKPDLVHALMYQAIQLCRFVKPRIGVPFKLVSSPRVNYRTRSRWTLWVDRLLRDQDDLLITESRASRDFLVHGLGYDEKRLATIYNGVEPPAASASPQERERRRRELGLEAGHVLFAAIGRLDEQKGHGVLLDAMARLKDSPARCVIIGGGPLHGRLEAKVRGLGLEGRVRLLGERADSASWLGACDVFVLPSLWEGLPNAVLEAMALGLPVLASSVDGVCEIITSGRDGLLTPPGDPAALARAACDLAADSSLRRRLGEAGRARVREGFSLRAMLAGYEAAYQGVLSQL